ncbi:hypothetical protein N1F78_02425 [Seonamhaeicola sp. MEBiC1930]|uniref:hypothetical protein n=1 Tax=Seonamhaeicola sp. MEBiC01930 TaxID=2976768 RepID=UPI00324B9937
MKYAYIYSLLLIFGFSTMSCEENEDYLDNTFRNYLGYEIEQANQKITSTVEGTEEGQYNAGSKNVYLGVINAALDVFNDNNSSQNAIDEAYKVVQSAGVNYFDEMVPFTSTLVNAISEANFLYNATEEGENEGNVKPGSKAPFLAAINEAQSFLDAGGYTQSELNDAVSLLTVATFAYEANIIGAFNVPIANASFEGSGFSTTDFSLIPNWNFTGNRYGWASVSSGVVSTSDDPSLVTTTDGVYAGIVNNYSNGIWQKLGEGVHPGSTYILSFDGSIRTSLADWTGAQYETFILSRVIVFNSEEGDFTDITVLDQQSNSLGSEIDLDDFISFTHSLTIPQGSPLLGKKMVVQFKTYEAGFAFENEIWTDSESSEVWVDSQVFVDNVSLKRE